MKKINLMPGALMSLVAIILLPAWTLFNWQALQSLHLRWLRFDEPYAVGYPALLLTVWWLWRHRLVLRQRVSMPSLSALILLSAVLIAGAAARLVQLMLLQQLVALGSLWLIAVALFGWALGRFLLFPFALLALGIPLWDFLVDPLRAMTVWFTQHMLDVLNIPAHVDGFLIGLPAGTIEVAGGCSGLNLFLAMVLVGLLFAESHQVPRMRRIATVLLAGAIGIFDNWVRVFALVVIAHAAGLQNHLVQHHGSFGWWIYAGGLLPYFWLAGKIERAGDHSGQGRRIYHASVRAFSSVGFAAPAFAALILLLGLTAGVMHLEERRGKATYGFSAPDRALPVMPDGAWLPQYSGQDVTQAWRVMRQGSEYEVLALMYVEQRNDKKLIYYSNRIADEYAVMATGTMPVAPGFAVNTAVVRNGEGGRLVWWFWWVDGAVSTSALHTKLLQLRAMLFGDPSAALLAVTLACPERDCRKTQTQVESGALQLLAELRSLRPLP